MNVKFVETQHYYPKSPIQGEENKREWLIYDTDHHVGTPLSPNVSSPNLSSHEPVPLDQNIEIDEPDPEPHESDHTASSDCLVSPPATAAEPQDPSLTETRVEKPIQTYSRRNKITEQQMQTAEPISTPRQGHESVPEASPDEIDMPIALRKGKRSCTQHPISRYVSYEKLSPNLRAFIASIEGEEIPSGYYEAVSNPKWKQAIEEELTALYKNQTWKITDLPDGKSVVGSKWVFTIKYNPDGSVSRYKARLVARGFTQTHGIDYQETFAPVAKFNTIKILLSLAASLEWPLFQLDVKNAFLNGDLEEEVYMEIPLGLRDANNAKKVCRLYKSLYGLKQSPRAWFERFTKVVKGFGYNQCQTDHTLFVKHHGDKIAVLIVYVDDIVLTGNDIEEITSLKSKLAAAFEVKDLGNLRYFLGMEVARTNRGISVSQRKYTLDLLKETGMLGAKPAETPMESNHKLRVKEDGTPVDKERYQALVGKLLYLSHTRPDICFSVNVVSQFASNPQEEHLTAVYRILRYLKMTPGKGLFFAKGNSRDVEVYTDADWAGSAIDRRSTTGYCAFVWGNLVTWRSKKQPVVARSSAEAEYRALALGICEGMWIIRLLKELRFETLSPTKVWCDNMATIGIANNPIHHDRTKHVEIDRNFIKEKIDTKVIDLAYISSGRQIADVMTKALTRIKFEEFRSKLGMINIYSPA